VASNYLAWLADFASQIVGTGSDLISAEITPVSTKTVFPVAFISTEFVGLDLDIKTVLVAMWEVTVLIPGKDAEQVVAAWEKLLVLLVPYGSANTMYAHGVNYVAPLRGTLPKGNDANINDIVEATLVFDVRSRYAY
jgi:hypothetical protein